MLEFVLFLSQCKVYQLICFFKLIKSYLLDKFCNCVVLQENLVEKKHHRLSRSARSGLSDRDAKPTAM